MPWLKTPKYIYVFEFKLDGSTEQALQQIDDRGLFDSVHGRQPTTRESRS